MSHAKRSHLRQSIAQRRVEKLLKLTLTQPQHFPELVRALNASEVIVWGSYVRDAAGLPQTKLYCRELAGHVVMPCFTSLRTLRVSEQKLGQQPRLVAPFTEFITMAQSQGYPVVINMDSLYGRMIPLEHMKQLLAGP